LRLRAAEEEKDKVRHPSLVGGTMKKTWMVFVATLFGLGILAARQAPPQAYPSIRNFLCEDVSFCTGGQPTLGDLEKLKAEGVKAIINLRQPMEHAAAAEAAKAKELGLRYFSIPVNGREPKDEQVEQFLKITNDRRNRPLFIHCASANRVAAFWMIRRVLVDGWRVEKAEEEAMRIGLRTPVMRQFARGYIERHNKK
jgi:uncharacterized protein (TIGR01244 family)